MNPLASNASSLAKNLRAEGATDPRTTDARATKLAAPQAAFAGLLGQQQQRMAGGAGGTSGTSGSGGSTAYNGSAFDVPPAQRLNTPKPAAASSAQAEANRALQAQATSRAQLEQAQAQTRARAPQTPHPPAAAPAPAPVQARAPEAPPEDAPRPAAPGAAHDGPSSAAEGPAAATARGAATESSETPSAATDTQALMDLMARLAQTGGAAVPGGPRGLPGAGGEAGLAGADGAATAGIDGAGRGAGSAAGGLGADQPGLGEALTEALTETRFDEARPAAPALEGLSASSHTAGASHASAALGAAALPTAPVADSAVMAQVPTPVTSPDFSQALASQLTTFARDGVQEAQLQLNPADMGPISVQITLDGSQAQIDFAATHARTREALEAAWPALAASLNSAGLTLGGGGVFEQRSGARDGDANGSGDAPGSRRVGEVADAGEPAARTTVRVDRQRGVLDLYA